MGRVRARREVPGPTSDAEELWYDTRRWPAWVDGLAHVAKIEGDWPHTGASVIWDTPPAGRGRVIETVIRYEVRAGQTLAVEDERLRGTQEVAFVPLADGVSITLTLDYVLKSGGPFRPLTDLFFIRRALRDSLKRTLLRFARELQSDRELL